MGCRRRISVWNLNSLNFVPINIVFSLDDQILLTIVEINKFNHKYWPRKSYFMIGISIKTLFYFF